MYPAHRKEVINKIRESLINTEKIIVSSTQLIEAGVDFDFPCVFRETAPLESIIQSAGRCNREGKMKKPGKVFIFSIINSGAPDKQYRSLAEFANSLYKGNELLLFDHDFYKEYYRKTLKLFIDADKKKIEDERKAFPYNYKGLSKPAPSAAAVIYDYYDGETRFKKFKALMNAVNKSDSGNLSKKEILHPRGWILLSFIMDPRTSLGRYKDYRISNYQLMEKLVDYCRVLPINKILKLEDVKERIIRYKQQQKEYKKMIKKYSYMKNNVLIIDLRNAPIIYTGNRFIEYCLFPRANISIRVMWGKQNQNIVFAVGYSIINKTCKVNVGKLMLKYGGGGHEKVGTCQVQVQEADRTLQELIEACTEN